MAKKKKRSRRQGFVSKGINIGLIALSFSRVIQLFMGFGAQGAIPHIIRESTFGLSEGSFDINAGLTMYSPVGAALVLNEIKKFAMKRFPVRR